MKLRGRGTASIYYGIGNTGKPNPSSAFVEVMEDGSATVYCGAADMGQGSTTVLAQIAATELGISLDRIHVVVADTGITPEAGVSSASRQTYISGNACRIASAQAKEVLLNRAVELLDEPVDNLVVTDGIIHVANDPERSVPISDAAAACRAIGRLAVGSGSFNPPAGDLDPDTGEGTAYGTFAYATHVAEVEVDTETGEVEVLGLWAAHDVGTAVNPQSAEGQIEGGVAIGLGFALMEEVVVEEGRIRARTFSEYMIPTALDVPAIHPILVEEPTPTGPFGAKGLGEPPTIATAAAIANAVHDATGVRITELPLTAERVFLALQGTRLG